MNFAGVYDIECGAWDRFRCGMLLGIDGHCFVTWDESDFFEALTSQTGRFYGHAAGRYDVLWALGLAIRRGRRWTARLRGAGVLSVRLGDVELVDSFGIAPMRLEKFAEMSGARGARKMAFPLACRCQRSCAGYCRLEGDLTPREKHKVEEYLRADCLSLLGAMQALEHRAALNGIDLRLTVGATAWATARAWLDLPKCEHDLARYTSIRAGYYGGRVEVFRTRATRGHRYDIHSSYPAALTRVELPTGQILPDRVSREASSDFARDRQGIFSADVFVPHGIDVPPLPIRTDERLLYPTGAISGTWTGVELRHALACGARLDRIRSGIVWTRAERLLAPFAERVWDLRAAAAEAGETSWAAWYKWLANSLTGKLAQRPEQSSMSFVPIDPLFGAPSFDELGPDPDIVREGDFGTFVRKTSTRVDACAHVEWSAHLTAEARVELHRQLLSAERPLYCDTDSVYSRDPLTRRLGDELGEWGYEGALRNWRALAPKVYRYHDDDGKPHVRGKGMPGLTSDGFDSLARGHSWSWSSGVEGLRTSAKRDDDRLFVRRAQKRGLHPVPGWIGGRELEPNGIDTRPTTLARYARRRGT